MEQVLQRGLTRHIGVSNYNVPLLLDLLCYCNAKPFSNQIELHPLLQQRNLVQFCERNGILVTAYSPLGGSYDYGTAAAVTLQDCSVLIEIAARHRTTVQDVAIAWHLHRSSVQALVAKSSRVERLRANFEVSLRLSEAEITEIGKIPQI